MKTYFIEILKSELTKRKSKNSAYSLRSFSRDLEVSPSSLSEIFNCKKSLSNNRIDLVLKKLKMDKNQSKMFELSVRYNNTKIPSKKKDFEEQFNSILTQKKSYLELSNDQLGLVTNSWLSFTFLEFFELQHLEKSYTTFSKKSGASIEETYVTLETLVAANLLKKTNDFYQPTYNSTSAGNLLESKSIQKHHALILDKAKNSLVEQSISQRDYQSVIFAFSSEQIVEVKKFVQKYQKEFIEKFCTDLVVKDSVYQFSTQFFRLDKRH